MSTTFLLALVIIITSSCSLFAQESTDTTPRKKVVSVTMAPAAILGSMFESIVEINLDGDNSIAIMGGAGSNYYTPFIYTVGAQYNWYALGDFHHGLQIGCELLYSHLGSPKSQSIWHPEGNTIGAGPYVGYKVILGGFTACLQVGPQLAYGKDIYPAALKSFLRQTPPTEELGLSTTLNATIGWSF